MVGINSQQAGLIRNAAIYGSKIMTDLPEVAEDYRKKGVFKREIIEKYEIIGKYGMPNFDVARLSLEYALGGFKGGLGIKSYEGLIREVDERKKLAREKKRDGWNKIVKLKKPLEGFDGEEIEASKLSVLLRGGTPWGDRKIGADYVAFSEIEIAYMYSQNPRYRKGKKIMVSMIANELNNQFHRRKKIRTPAAVKDRLRMERLKDKR